MAPVIAVASVPYQFLGEMLGGFTDETVALYQGIVTALNIAFRRAK